MTKFNYSLEQISFFNGICADNQFKDTVLKRSNIMGLDGAFYFTLGEFQTLYNNYSFDYLSDESQENFISMIIIEFPELEF